MKKVFLILSIVVLICAIYITAANITNLQPIYYGFGTGNNAEISAAPARLINIALYTGIILISGLFASAGIVYSFLSDAKSKIKAYERELEKTTVTGESNASKVDVLTAKIQTLETALNNILNEKTKLEKQVNSLNTELEKYKN